MKRPLLLLLLIVFLVKHSYSQATNTFPDNGPVGIGTLSPTHSLTFASGGTGYSIYNTADQTTNYERLVVQPQSNVFTIGSYHGGTGAARSITFGVQSTAGTNTLSGRVFTINNAATPSLGIYNFTESTGGVGSMMTLNTGVQASTGIQKMLSIQGTVAQTGTSSYTALQIAPFESSVGSGDNFLIDAGVNSAASGGGTHTSYMVLTTAGNLGLGTTNTQGYKLAVNGSAIATSVVVKLYANWPDYVFKSDYKLPSLNTIKTFIDQNHHLPEMPSEEDIAKNGLNLGEINKLLVKKVEELTLYVIESNKKQTEQDERIRKMEQQIELLTKKASQ